MNEESGRIIIETWVKILHLSHQITLVNRKGVSVIERLLTDKTPEPLSSYCMMNTNWATSKALLALNDHFQAVLWICAAQPQQLVAGEALEKIRVRNRASEEIWTRR
jgi:hypothetical protein